VSIPLLTEISDLTFNLGGMLRRLFITRDKFFASTSPLPPQAMLEAARIRDATERQGRYARSPARSVSVPYSLRKDVVV